MSRLRAKAKACSELYLATDEDREGEAISWHLLDLLLKDEAQAAADPAHASSVAPPVPVHRVIFHEITPGAVGAGLENPRCVRGDSGGNAHWLADQTNQSYNRPGLSYSARTYARIDVFTLSVPPNPIPRQAHRPEPGGGAARPAGAGPRCRVHHESLTLEEDRHGYARGLFWRVFWGGVLLMVLLFGGRGESIFVTPKKLF